MNIIFKINSQILKSYNKRGYTKDKLKDEIKNERNNELKNEDLFDRFRKDKLKGEIENQINKELKDQVEKYIGEYEFFDIIDNIKSGTKCFAIALSYQTIYITSGILNCFKIKNNLDSYKEYLEKSFESNIKEANPLIAMGIYASKFLLSEAIYYIDKKNGKVENIKNISESNKYLKDLVEIAIDSGIVEKIPTSVSAVSEVVIKGVKEKISDNINRIYPKHAKVSIDAIEESINSLKKYKLRQIELLNELSNEYNEFIDYDKQYYYKVEEMINKIEKNISFVLEECTKSIYILHDKKVTLENYYE